MSTPYTHKASMPAPDGGRADALTDMPAGLDRDAQRAYVRGYAKGCMCFTRKHGAPSVIGIEVRHGLAFPTAEQRMELHRLTITHAWDRHPTAHRAALRELNAYLSHPARVTERARVLGRAA